jgi:glycosyltransferase involved in cell wall biosynthesis
LAIYSSEWAAKTAIDHYGVDPGKVRVVPFGANLESSITYDEMKEIVARRSSPECKLLFLGVDWKRKGGDMAVKVTANLNELGINDTLHVAGINNLPFSREEHPYVVNHGFISKSTKEGRNKIIQLLLQSNFLLLPTLADCTPIVYSEANSFGLPCITTNVGGIPSIIRDDVNGRMFSLESDSSDYAKYIKTTFENQGRYRELCYSSFGEYENRLNWKVAGQSVTKLITQL